MGLSPLQGRVLRVRTVGVIGVLALALALLAAAPAEGQEGDRVASERIGGTDRFHTAALVSAAAFETAEVVHVVTGRDFPDALAGSFAAGAVGGPLLLVTRDGIPPQTWDELERLDPQLVVLIGGDAAISDAVRDEFDAAGYDTDRIFGGDRYETAAEVATHYGELLEIGTIDGDRAAILASGENFPDALSIGPAAAGVHLPLFLTQTATVEPHVDAALEQLDIERLIVVGGDAAVRPSVADHYQAGGYTVERWFGADRTATAADVAENLRNRLGFSFTETVLARGNEYPDALTASVYAGLRRAPIVLARNQDVLSPPTESVLAAACPQVDLVRAIGGGAAVSESVLAEAVAAAEACLDLGPVEISSFTTPLEPGQSRNTNIHLAADYVEGSVIPPGATFSLNEAIGPRTRERGFVENGFIDETGETVSVVGGGVSQVATTFMNAAWEAGIHLAHFRQHTIYFPRYPMCREATIIWDTLDVLVVNDTPHEITVTTSYTDSSVTFTLLGTPWAQVDSWIGEPYNVEGPGGAFTVDCGRVITYPDGNVNEEAYSWRYDSGFPG